MMGTKVGTAVSAAPSRRELLRLSVRGSSDPLPPEAAGNPRREAAPLLSGTLEEALADRPARQQRRDWLESNHTAIRPYNRRVKVEGSFGDRVRRF